MFKRCSSTVKVHVTGDPVTGGGANNIPEPASLALLGLGLAGLGAMRRRKKIQV